MKKALIIVLFLLCASLLSAANATTLGCNLTQSGNYTIYTYILTSSETSDILTGIHVYAPTLPTNVFQSSTPSGWKFLVSSNSSSGGSDISWTSIDTSNYNLTYGKSLTVSIKALSSLQHIDNYKSPGFLGNWGYESLNYSGCGAFVMYSSVSVPTGNSAASVPEPCSAITLILGCIALLKKHR